MTETQHDIDKRVLESGRVALTILQSEVPALLEEELGLYREAIMNTDDKEQKLRESIYYKHAALKDFIAGLHQRRDAALAIVERRDREAGYMNDADEFTEDSD